MPRHRLAQRRVPRPQVARRRGSGWFSTSCGRTGARAVHLAAAIAPSCGAVVVPSPRRPSRSGCARADARCHSTARIPAPAVPGDSRSAPIRCARIIADAPSVRRGRGREAEHPMYQRQAPRPRRPRSSSRGAFVLGLYFTFASVQGDYGLFRRLQIEAEAEALKAERDGAAGRAWRALREQDPAALGRLPRPRPARRAGARRAGPGARRRGRRSTETPSRCIAARGVPCPLPGR